MKKILLVLLLLASIVSVVFARTKKKAAKSQAAITYISMHRSACFGRCPDYKIELYSTGLVKYNGYYFVRDSGVFEKNMGKTVVSNIFKQFKEYHVDTCKNNYEQIIADLPGLYYVIRYSNGKTKEIHNAHFGPEFLQGLAREIDKSIKVDASWKKTANEATR